MRRQSRRGWRAVLLVALGVSGAAACRDKAADGPAAQAPGAANDPFALPESDERMIAAREMARVSAVGFIDALRSGKTSVSGFALRTAGPGGQVWLRDVTYDGHTFRGRVSGPPYRPGAAPGVEMKVKRADITDWMYLDSGRMVGGFSVRATRDGLPPEKRAEFEKQLPFRIE